MEEVGYEYLPTHNPWIHMTAGAMAGMAEHCAMFPIDSIKTRMQSLCPCPSTHCNTPLKGLWAVMRREGLLRPLRGVDAIALGCVPAHALYFSVYEKMKSLLTKSPGHSNSFAYALSGTCATIVHDAVMNPAEVVKQRMQMVYSPYGGSLECARCIFRREGLIAFYRSYSVQLTMNVPFQIINFVSYESWQHVLNPQHKYDPSSHIIAGGIAGGSAAAITTPLDCVKTVLNTQQAPEVRMDGKNRLIVPAPVCYRGVLDSVASIYHLRGITGFFRGIQARIIFQMPATALSWSVYELFKFLLSEKLYESESGIGRF
ncbi:hypothetical protein AB6A40_004731 [Gnathostoma spinigerum]|uniref:Mitoferrin-1 n=1 Tax=Gnathostoma spinigerum TaxID=75299 RepID=A0ABD6EN84_9BILA